jgi:hypothetical protein
VLPLKPRAHTTARGVKTEDTQPEEGSWTSWSSYGPLWYRRQIKKLRQPWAVDKPSVPFAYAMSAFVLFVPCLFGAGFDPSDLFPPESLIIPNTADDMNPSSLECRFDHGQVLYVDGK